MAEPKPRTRRSDERSERSAPRRRRDERSERSAPRRRRAEADAPTEDESEPAPRRRRTTEPDRRRRTEPGDAPRRRTTSGSATRKADGSRLGKGRRSVESQPENDDRSSDARPRRRGTASGIDARHAAAAAAKFVQELTGTQPEGLTSLDHSDDAWRIGVEVLESRRIPDSTDILAEYQVELDRDGDLVSYRRERRYHRGRVEGDQQ